MLALAAALLLAQTSQYPGSSWNNPSYTLQDSGIQVVLILPDGGPLAVNQGAAGNQPWLVEIAPDAGPVAVSGTVTANLVGDGGNVRVSVSDMPNVTGTVTATLVGDGGNVRVSISDAPAVTGTVSCNLLADGGNVAVAIASGTTAVTQATGTNLHAVLDTTSTTAVTQATGTNLHAVLDTTSTTAVTQATAASLNATVVNAAGTAAIGTVGDSNTTPAGTLYFKCITSAAASTLMPSGLATLSRIACVAFSLFRFNFPP